MVLTTMFRQGLSKGCDHLRLPLFVFADGNIGSEDSSLSDALVLEDGRLPTSCLRTGPPVRLGLSCEVRAASVRRGRASRAASLPALLSLPTSPSWLRVHWRYNQTCSVY